MHKLLKSIDHCARLVLSIAKPNKNAPTKVDVGLRYAQHQPTGSSFFARAISCKRFLSVALLACVIPFAQAQSTPLPDDPALIARAQKLEENLRCLVCQNQSIAESTADLANDLRNQVRTQLRAGKSEQQIIDYMVERYGDFVLYDPPFRAETLLLWLGPAALLLIALGGFAWTLRNRQREQQSDAPLSAADHARAAALLDEKPDNDNTPSGHPKQ